MLLILTKKLCPLMSLALAFGCGKQINEPKTTDNNGTSQSQELPSVLTLQIEEAVSMQKIYYLQRNAWFKLPSKLKTHGESAVGKRVKILYNVLANNYYEFHCFYKSQNHATELALENCESSQGVEIISRASDLESMDFPMDKDLSVKMQLTNGSNTGIKIDAIYLVDWK